MPHFTVFNGQVIDLPIRKTSQSYTGYIQYILAHYFAVVGTHGEALLYDDETILDVSRELTAAAVRCGFGVEIISEHRRTVFFRIVESQQTKMEI